MSQWTHKGKMWRNFFDFALPLSCLFYVFSLFFLIRKLYVIPKQNSTNIKMKTFEMWRKRRRYRQKKKEKKRIDDTCRTRCSHFLPFFFFFLPRTGKVTFLNIQVQASFLSDKEGQENLWIRDSIELEFVTFANFHLKLSRCYLGLFEFRARSCRGPPKTNKLQPGKNIICVRFLFNVGVDLYWKNCSRFGLELCRAMSRGPAGLCVCNFSAWRSV